MIQRFPSKSQRLASALLQAIDHAMSNGVSRSALLFVGCFSTQSDSLSQWRAYGRGEGGFAIGFKASSILKLGNATLVGKGVRLLPCNYDVDLYRVSFNQAVELAESEFAQLADKHGDAFALSEFLQRTAWYGSALKNPAFVSESEWRLIYHHIPVVGVPMQVRHLPNMTFRPFVEVDLGSKDEFFDSIEEVVIGPQRHMALAKEGLQSFMETELGFSPKVELSSVPFRSMD